MKYLFFYLCVFVVNPAQADTIKGELISSSTGYGLEGRTIVVDLSLTGAEAQYLASGMSRQCSHCNSRAHSNARIYKATQDSKIMVDSGFAIPLNKNPLQSDAAFAIVAKTEPSTVNGVTSSLIDLNVDFIHPIHKVRVSGVASCREMKTRITGTTQAEGKDQYATSRRCGFDLQTFKTMGTQNGAASLSQAEAVAILNMLHQEASNSHLFRWTKQE